MKTKKPAGEKLTIGLDLGDRRHYACVLDASGEILAEEAIVNTPEVLTAWSARYPGATYVMETGTHSPWVSRLLNAQGHSVIVANARKLRAISQSQTKSDREDAQMLARLGRADPKLLSPVRHRSEETQRALVRLKVREALVRNALTSKQGRPFSSTLDSSLHRAAPLTPPPECVWKPDRSVTPRATPSRSTKKVNLYIYYPRHAFSLKAPEPTRGSGPFCFSRVANRVWLSCNVRQILKDGRYNRARLQIL